MDAEAGRRSEEGAAEVPRHARTRWNPPKRVRHQRLNTFVSAASEKARQGHVGSLEALKVFKFAKHIFERQMVLLWGTRHIALQ